MTPSSFWGGRGRDFYKIPPKEKKDLFWSLGYVLVTAVYGDPGFWGAAFFVTEGCVDGF